MRNLKSMVAFLVVAAMLFASFTTFAYTDVAADADYATAVEVLSGLEILKGDDKGNFNPDNTITRAESAAVIVRLLGLEEAAAGAAGATQFVDVAADHWGSGYINMAAQTGIIAGYGDGNFGPEDAVTYEQFVKMLVCALGYEPKALTKGTYPTGYLIAAKEMKLTKGVAGSAGQEAARSVVAELAYNALDIDLMEQSGWGSDISYDVAEGKTLLTEKLEITKVEGKLTEVNSDSVKIGEGEDAISAKAEGADTALVGYNVEAYLKEDAKGKDVLVAIAKDQDSVVLAFAGDKIEINDAKTEVVYDEDEDALAVDTTSMYLNGTLVDDLDAFTATENMAYEFVLNEDEDTIETIFATKYVMAVVKEFDAKRERIVLNPSKNGYESNYIKLDAETLEDEELTYTLVDVNGAAVEPADLTEDAVLTIKKSNVAIDMVVSTATVEGKITATSYDEDDVLMYTIGGTKYYKSAGAYSPIAIKDEGTFYLNAAGKIVDFKATESTINLAFVYRVKEASNGFTYYVLDKDGLNTYNLVDETKVITDAEGTKVAAEDIAAAEFNLFTKEGEEEEGVLTAEEIEDGFYVLEANAEGTITKLYAAEAPVALFDLDDDDEPIKVAYNATTNKLTEYLADEVLVFNLAVGATKDDISVAALSSLVDKKEYVAYKLDADEDDYVTAMVVTSDSVSATYEAPIAIVTASEETLDDEDQTIYELTVLVEGEEKKIISDEDYAAGTVITYILDGEGKIDAIKEIATIAKADGTNSAITLDDAAAALNYEDDDVEFVYGSVAEIKKGNIAVVNVGDATEDIKLSEVTAYVVNYNKKPYFTVGDALDLGANETNVGPATYDDDENPETPEVSTEGVDDVAHYALFVLDEEGALKTIIIVEPIKGVYENLGLDVVED